MTDMHCHILFGVDDGAKSIDISLELLKQEIANNVKNIILTPHQNKEEKNLELILNNYNILKEKAKDLDINIGLGSEIYYYEGMISDLKNNNLLTFNGTKNVLIEFSTRMETTVLDVMGDLITLGYKPIIAHIERYYYLDKKEYLKLNEMGVKIQVNTKTFGDKHFKKNLKFLLKNNLIDYIGTDCHNLNSRGIEYKEMLDVLKKYPKEYDKLVNNDYYFNE